MDDFEVRVTTERGATVVALRGELDIATIPALRRDMAAARQSATEDVVIDARDLTFVGLQGFRALLSETQALRHGRRRVRMVNLRPAVRRAARALRIESLLGTK